MRLVAPVLSWVVAVSALAVAQTPRDPSEVESTGRPIEANGLRFSRMFAPADRIADWPRGGVSYLPVKVAEFEQLLRASQDAAPGVTTATPRLEKAEYAATVEGDDLRGGTARFDIVYAGPGSALLMLDPCELALCNPRWDGPQPARVALGTTPEEKTAVLVERSGRLLFDWSLRGRRERDGSLQFRLGLPRCPMQQIQIVLPVGQTVSSDQGLTEIVIGDNGNSRATIQLGGHTQAALRVSAANNAVPQASLSLLRQSMTYDFSSHGVNVSAQLKLDVHQEPLRQIAVVLDAPLRPITVRYGEALIPWSLTTDATTGQSRLVLDLSDQPIHGTNRLIQLGLLAPLPTEGRWKLPGVRPEGLFWQGGTATLVVQSPLALGRMLLGGCRQINAAPLPAPLAGESLELQYFTPQPAIDVDVAPREERVQYASGTSVTLADNEVKGQVVAEVRALQGTRFELEADVPRPWMVDSIDSIPAGGVDDWTIEDADSSTRKLTIRLKKAVQSQRSVRLVLTGRRRSSPLGETLSADDLQMIDFHDAQPTRRLLSVRAAVPYDLKITCTEEVTRLDPQRLDEADAELLREPPSEIFFVVDAAAADWRVRLSPRAPLFRADVAVQATIRADMLTEAYVMQCTPESTGLESVFVHFSQVRQERPVWSVATEGEGAVTARPLSITEQHSAGFGDEGETWEVKFRHPRTAAFELRATRSAPLTGETPLALASLAGTTAQQGTLVVRTASEVSAKIDNRRLMAIPAESPLPGEYSNIIGAYRFDPARDGQASSEPPIFVEQGSGQEKLAAWAWNCRVESRYARDGNASHSATFYLESAGRSQVRVSLPPQVEVRSVWVDGTRESVARDAAGVWVVDLPSRRRFVTLAVCYTTAEGPLGLLSWLAPLAPSIDVPVMTRQAVVWLPPGYLEAGNNWVGLSEQLTWSERLFGPLGRAAHAQAFDPFTVEDWTQLVGSNARVNSAEAQFVVDRLGAALVSLAQNPTRREWGTLLAQFDAELKKQTDGRELALWVDPAALDRVGILSRTPLVVDKGDSPSQRAAALLSASGLALIVDSDSVIVTTAAEAASRNGQYSPTTQGSYVVVPRSLPTDAQQLTDERGTRFVSAEVWRSQPPALQPPWSASSVSEDIGGFSPGWTAYRMESNEAVTPPLRIVHRESMVALGWTLFLSVAAGCVWLCRRAERLIAGCGVLGVLALLVPAAFVPSLTGAFLGVVFALVWRWIRPRMPMEKGSCSTAEAPAAQPISTRTLVTGVLLLTVLVALGHADEPRESPSGDPIYRVFVPIDDQRRPVGDTYYLPKPMYDELYRRASTTVEHSANWLIEGATYRGTLVRETPQSPLAISEFKASYVLWTFGAKSRVRIPLAAVGINLAPDAARLDNAAIDPNWEKDGAALLVDVAGSGPHRLELAMRLTPAASGRSTGIDLAIPAVATSRLELATPADLGEIEIPSARGAAVRDSASGLISAELGATDRLTVRWAEGPASASVPAALEVDELLWLRVQPGSILVDAKFKYRILSGKVEQLSLSADSRLRLLPPAERKPETPEARIVQGDPQTIVFDLPRTVPDDITINARFLLTGTSSIGNLRLPQLEAVGAKSTSRMLAVSVDPALQWEEKSGAGVMPMLVAEFVTAWGGSETKPVVAHRLQRDEIEWALATQPREPKLITRQLLSLDVRGGRAELAAAISATTTDGYLYQYRIQIPEAVHVESVTVHEEEADRPARWSRDEAGTVTVFLAEPSSGEQKVLVKGWLSTAVRGPFALPSIAMEGAESTACRVLLFRRADALVKVRNVMGLDTDVVVDHEQALSEALQEGLFDKRAAERVRFVGAWQGTGNSAAATIDVTSNAPFVSGTETVTLARDGDKWFADIECRLEVVAGVLDVLRFSVPADLPGPFEVTPRASVEIANLPGRDQRHLIIRPRSAIEGQYRVHFRGPVAPVRDRIQAPDVLPLRIDPLNRYVVLPSQADGRQFAWETQGLRAARLPANMSTPTMAEPLVYRVEGERFSAELKAVERVANAPKVRLADVRIACLADGTCRGAMTFDVEPAGASSCLLEMPDDYRVISVTRGGLLASLEAAGDNRWTLSLGPPQLPQRIEVIFSGKAKRGSRGNELPLDAPRLVGMPVDRTLWTVSGPVGDERIALVGAEASDLAHGELLRMQTTAALVGTAAELTSATEPAEEESHWYSRWARRMAVSRLEFQRQRLRQKAIAAAGGENDLTAQDISAAATAEREEIRAARQMGVALSASATTTAEEAGELWAWSLEPDATTQVAQGVGPIESITVRLTRLSRGDAGQRLLAALVLMLLTAAAIVGYRHGVPGDPTWRWSHGMVMLAGLAWWLWLSPSVFGLIIVMVGALSLIAPAGRWIPRFVGRRRAL